MDKKDAWTGSDVFSDIVSVCAKRGDGNDVRVPDCDVLLQFAILFAVQLVEGAQTVCGSSSASGAYRKYFLHSFIFLAVKCLADGN